MNCSVLTTPAFEKQVKKLSKKFRNIAEDIRYLSTELEAGQILGDAMMGIGRRVYKVRLKSRDMTKGKSGGYRVIYYLQSVDQIYLLMIYQKAEKASVLAVELQALLNDL